MRNRKRMMMRRKRRHKPQNALVSSGSKEAPEGLPKAIPRLEHVCPAAS